MQGTGAVLRKEAGDLLRERRLAVFLLMLSVALAVPVVVFGQSIGQGTTGRFPPGFDELITPIVFVGPIPVLLLALILGSDSVSRERDETTLVLLATSPASRTGIWLGKLGGALLAYAAVAAVTLLFLVPHSLVLGWATLEAVFWLLLVPFLALYLFLLGVGFLASTLLSTSRASIGAALGVDLLLFLLQREPPGLGGFLREFAPGAYRFLEYTPFDAAAVAARAVAHGRPLPAVPLAVTLGGGLLLLGLSLAVFRRSEVPP